MKRITGNVFTGMGLLLLLTTGCRTTPGDVSLRIDPAVVEQGRSDDLAVDGRNRDGLTPLMLAAGEGQLDVVNALLDRGADIHAVDKNACTALRFAAGGGHLDVVNALLSRGADVNARAYNGWTPLMFAAGGGHLDVVKVLLDKGADPDIRAYNGLTSQRLAASLGHLAIVDFLKQYAGR